MKVSGLPSHELKLNEGSIIIFLRDLNAVEGLLMVRKMWVNILELTNSHRFEYWIRGFDLSPSDTVLLLFF